MTIPDQAFRVGEYAKIAPPGVLAKLADEFSERILLFPEMQQYAGQTVRISSADEVMGYQFFNIPGDWMEGALLDPGFSEQKITPETHAPASQTYRAAIASNSSFVEVCDLEGNLFLSFRSDMPEIDAKTLNRIARLRTKIAFEHLFNFSGTGM